MRILSPCSSSTAVASVSAWSPSVVTSGVVSAVDKTGYVTSTLCAGGVDAVLLPWLGSFYLELVSSGSDVQFPFLGSLFSADWGFLLRRQASNPLHRDEATAVGLPPEHCTPERSVVQVHAMFGVSLMAIQNFEVSSSAWVSALSFFLGAFLFHSVARQSTQQRRLQPATKMILWTSNGCQCNFLFFRRSLGMRGLDVKVMY